MKEQITPTEVKNYNSAREFHLEEQKVHNEGARQMNSFDQPFRLNLTKVNEHQITERHEQLDRIYAEMNEIASLQNKLDFKTSNKIHIDQYKMKTNESNEINVDILLQLLTAQT